MPSVMTNLLGVKLVNDNLLITFVGNSDAHLQNFITFVGVKLRLSTGSVLRRLPQYIVAWA